MKMEIRRAVLSRYVCIQMVMKLMESMIFSYDGQEAKLPAEGSIPRGWMPYEYEDNLDGYDAAKAE